jgi:BolA family transcriptional regulator, general stress-responsive regulator
MSRLDRLNQLLQQTFPAAAFQVFDDSAAHAGHGHGFDGETHYRLHIADESFRGQLPITIHRRILAAIKPETDAGMHSFVIERAEAPKQ